jgi:hypothetical protein
MIIQYLLFTIFFLLAALHFYWVFGGKWALFDALPSKENGEPLLRPSKFPTSIVGIGLLGFALFYLNQTTMLNIELPSWIFKYGRWIIPSIFLIRSVGEFKYVGFTKSVKGTAFAKKDTSIYSPLCLLLGTGGMLINFL